MSIDLNFVSKEKESPKIYENNFLNWITKAHWIIPFVFFLPVIVFFLYRSIFVIKTTWYAYAIIIPAVVLFWSFLEWILHKHVLHYNPNSPLNESIVNKIHEAHHQYPNDDLRFVVPLWASIPGGVVFYFGFRLMVGAQYIDAFFAILVSMYLIYEFCHIGAHKLNWKNKYFQKMKKHHLKHHFHDHERGFGFTNELWDSIFKTSFKKGANS